MRRRRASRLIILDPDDRVLLFQFEHDGRRYWATPGGALEEHESYLDAARRELFEETGIVAAFVHEEVAVREFVLRLPDGEDVIAEEHFFVVHPSGIGLSR